MTKSLLHQGLELLKHFIEMIKTVGSEADIKDMRKQVKGLARIREEPGEA